MAHEVAAPPAKTFRDMIQSPSYQQEIAKALPAHLTTERLTRVILTAMNKTPKLADCTPASLWEAALNCASLGLEPGPLGHCYLIPFANRRKVGNQWVDDLQCQFMIGYKGLADLAYRSGKVASLGAEVVYDGDVFEFEFGMNEKLKHVPTSGKHGDPVWAYSYCRLNGGGFKFVVLTVDEVNTIRDRSQGYQQAVKSAKEYNKEVKSPWTSDWGEMAKKTAFKRLSKMLPLSPELRDAIALDEKDEAHNAKPVEIIKPGERFAADLGLPPPPVHHEDDDGSDDQDLPKQSPADLAATFARCVSATSEPEAIDCLLKATGKTKVADVPAEKIAAAIAALTDYIG